MSTEPALRWSSAGLTDVGRLREINEDALLENPEKGLWAVADGMGGHHAGDVASRMTVQALDDLELGPRLSHQVAAIEDCLIGVNWELLEMARKRGPGNMMGTTVVALLVHGRYGMFLWAGDSRAYLYGDGILELVSQDHSHVQELVDQGLLLREDAHAHPEANIITRAVGASEPLFLDMEVMELQAGDRVLLCSDGLYRELSDEEIAAGMVAGNCADACRDLVELALQRGGRDNVSAVIVEFEAR